MKNYVSLRIGMNPCSEDMTDLMAAFLADLGYESFEPDESGLTAYIDAALYDEEQVKETVAGFPMPAAITTEATEVAGKDWNEEWERNYFKPIVVDDKCVIHSTFHKDVPTATYDIVIDPKMAFGTGHHATTSMMIKYILEEDIKGKSVVDMGTGTGILAILSMMCGAANAVGIEIDPGACDNARENVALNGCEVEIIEGDSSRLRCDESADLFIANINRNVILADIERYAATLRGGGVMLLSGFYSQDVALVERAASLYGLHLVTTRTEGEGWTAMKLRKE